MKKSFAFLIVFSLATNFSYASGSKAEFKEEQDKETTDFVVNPVNLRERLMSNNVDILLSANRVHRAKDEANLARARLLPSLNLGAVLISAANPTFLIGTVEILLPFLLPSRWFEKAAADELFKADKEAYKIVQLNTYASAYSLYVSLINDKILEGLLQSDFYDWDQIHKINEESHRLGYISDNDYALSRGERNSALIRWNKVQAMIIDQKSTVRLALALNYKREIVIQDTTVAESAIEGSDIDQTLDLALKEAPESFQMDHLIQAATYQKWARAFGFAGGFSASSVAARGENASTAFSAFTGGGFFEIGFDRIPLINLSQRNIEELQIRRGELRREMGKILESVFGQFPLIRDRYALAKETEDLYRQNFNRNLEAYRMGAMSFDDLLKSRIFIHDATLERVRAEADLNLMRINLHRIMRTDQFQFIKGCENPELVNNGSDRGRNRPICGRK